MIKNAEEIREQASIYSIVSKFVDLKRAGVQYKGLCPFHGEKTPSFHVSEAKGIYKCFGCGEGGDAIDFLIKHENLTYPEALEFVAREEGINVEYEHNRQEVIQRAKVEKKEKQVAWEINRKLAEVGPQILGIVSLEDDEMVDIDGRTYKASTLKKFMVSSATDGKILRKLARKHKWEKEELIRVGLLKLSKAGRTFFAFKNRILFPIVDHQGNVAGFAGRKFRDDQTDYPKYLNSKESLVYQKSKILYGLKQGWRSIREKEFAYIVEGYTDVLSLYDNGVENVVAPCGTALTVEQVKLLGRYTDRVVLLYDNDLGGRKAAMQNLELILAGGLKASIATLPPAEDPDSFMRSVGVDNFRKYIDEHTEDALIWRVMLDYNKEDIHSREEAINLASRLIALIENEILRSQYVNELCHSKYFGKIKRDLTGAVKEARETRISRKDTHDLTPTQQSDLNRFGIFAKAHKYFTGNTDSAYEIANFIIKPIMLSVGNERSHRIVEVINEHGSSFVRDINSDDFVELASFKKRVESQGNFLFKGDYKDFMRVKMKVYSEMARCFPIYTLGYHQQGGFWTWGNGISAGDKFLPVDDYGIVEHEGVKYFLPAFSKIRSSSMSDDQENSYETHEEFYFPYGSSSITLADWGRRMVDVYGPNGMVAVAYFLASLFRDVIYRRHRHFPHLNLFGPQGSGKSTMAISLQYLFRRGPRPFDLTQGTNVGFYRLLEQARNAIAWYDEYSNDLDHRRIGALKGAYDGSGHVKGVMSSDSRTVSTKVHSAAIVSGQHQPVSDIALFERCISLNFPEKKFTAQEQARARELRNLEESGRLKHITAHVQTYRDDVEEKLDTALVQLKEEMAPGFEGNVTPKARVLNNYGYLLAVARIVSEKEPLGFDFNKLLLYSMERIIDQSMAMHDEDDLSTWWMIIQQLIDQGSLLSEIHYRAELKSEITHHLSRNESTQKIFDEPKWILMLNFPSAAGMYQEWHLKQHRKSGLRPGAIKTYLQSKEYFIGMSKAVKFGASTRSAMLFDLSCDEAPISVPSYSEESAHEPPDRDENQMEFQDKPVF